MPTDIAAATRSFLATLGEAYPLGVPVKLWDGSEVLLGPERKHATLALELRDPGFFPSLARSPREQRMWRLAIEHGLAWCDMELEWLAKARRELTAQRKEPTRWTRKAK